MGTIKNVNFDRMDQSAKDELKQSVAKTIAKAADTDEDAVNVTLSKGSVKVSATIDLEEKIAAMEGEADMEGKEVDLVSEMKAIKSEVRSDMQSEAIQKEVLTVATSVEGVKDAAEGDIEVSKPETEIVAESVTMAPAVEVVTDAGSPSPSPSPTPATTAPDQESVSGAVGENAFFSMVIGSLAAVVLQ